MALYGDLRKEHGHLKDLNGHVKINTFETGLETMLMQWLTNNEG